MSECLIYERNPRFKNDTIMRGPGFEREGKHARTAPLLGVTHQLHGHKAIDVWRLSRTSKSERLSLHVPIDIVDSETSWDNGDHVSNTSREVAFILNP